MTPHVKVEAKDGHVILSEYAGKALDHKAPKSINITGTLPAPYQFLVGKKSLFADEGIHLLIDNAAGRLTLVCNDADPYQTHTIVGALTKDTALQAFKINTDHRWSVSELVKFIKTMRYYFSDPVDHRKLIDSLQKWTARVQTVIKQHNDTSGNSLVMLEKSVGEIDLIRTFNLTIPIYQGYAKQKFSVEIGFDPKNTAVDLYLISDELYEREIEFRHLLIGEEVDKFSEFVFSKVVVA